MKKFLTALTALAGFSALSLNVLAATNDTATADQAASNISNFPWARVITLAVIVVLIVVAIILSKTNSKLGQRINKFFKEYWSEIKKELGIPLRILLKLPVLFLYFLLSQLSRLACSTLDLHKSLNYLQIFLIKEGTVNYEFTPRKHAALVCSSYLFGL